MTGADGAMVDVATPLWEVVIRVLASMTAGALLGWERERLGRPAGLRTYILVSVGATIMAIIAAEFLRPDFEVADGVTLDPMRLLEGVVGGIGFLCAGTVMRAGGDVRGLTTAAGLWIAGIIGLAIGMAMYELAAIGVGVALLTLSTLRAVEARVAGRPNDGPDRAPEDAEETRPDER